MDHPTARHLDRSYPERVKGRELTDGLCADNLLPDAQSCPYRAAGGQGIDRERHETNRRKLCVLVQRQVQAGGTSVSGPVQKRTRRKRRVPADRDPICALESGKGRVVQHAGIPGAFPGEAGRGAEETAEERRLHPTGQPNHGGQLWHCEKVCDKIGEHREPRALQSRGHYILSPRASVTFLGL